MITQLTLINKWDFLLQANKDIRKQIKEQFIKNGLEPVKGSKIDIYNNVNELIIFIKAYDSTIEGNIWVLLHISKDINEFRINY